MHAVHERHCLNPVPALPSILFRLWLLSRYLGSVCTKTAQHRPGPWAPCTLSRNSAPRRGARYGIHGCGEFRVTALSYLQSSSQRRQRCFPPPRHCYGEHPARQKNSLDLLRTADAHSPRRDLCRQRTLSWHTASIVSAIACAAPPHCGGPHAPREPPPSAETQQDATFSIEYRLSAEPNVCASDVSHPSLSTASASFTKTSALRWKNGSILSLSFDGVKEESRLVDPLLHSTLLHEKRVVLH